MRGAWRSWHIITPVMLKNELERVSYLKFLRAKGALAFRTLLFLVMLLGQV